MKKMRFFFSKIKMQIFVFSPLPPRKKMTKIFFKKQRKIQKSKKKNTNQKKNKKHERTNPKHQKEQNPTNQKIIKKHEKIKKIPLNFTQNIFLKKNTTTTKNKKKKKIPKIKKNGENKISLLPSPRTKNQKKTKNQQQNQKKKNAQRKKIKLKKSEKSFLKKIFFEIFVMFLDFGQQKTFVSRKTLCITHKVLCIPKKVFFVSPQKASVSPKSFLCPKKSFCIPKKVFCITKKSFEYPPKNFVSQNKHHLRGTLYPKKKHFVHKKVAPIRMTWTIHVNGHELTILLLFLADVEEVDPNFVMATLMCFLETDNAVRDMKAP